MRIILERILSQCDRRNAAVAGSARLGFPSTILAPILSEFARACTSYRTILGGVIQLWQNLQFRRTPAYFSGVSLWLIKSCPAIRQLASLSVYFAAYLAYFVENQIVTSA